MLNREWTIEVYANHTILLAIGICIVDSLTCCFSCRTHEDEHLVGIFCTIVREELVFATGNLADFLHVFLNDARNCFVVRIAAFTVSEESLRVFCHTLSHWMLWAQAACTELSECFHVNQWTKVFHVHFLNLLILVRGAETVEEVDEWHACFQC